MKGEIGVMLVMCAFSLFCCFAGCNIGSEAARQEVRREAVRAGVATYSSDARGDSKFEWKTSK